MGPEVSNNVNDTQEDEDKSDETEEEGDGDDETSEDQNAGTAERGEKSKHGTRDEDTELTRNCPECGTMPGWVPSHVRACGMLRFNNTSLRAFANGDIHVDLEEEEIEYLEKVREHYRKKDEEYRKYRESLDHRKKEKEGAEGAEDSEEDEFSLSIDDLEKNTGMRMYQTLTNFLR